MNKDTKTVYIDFSINIQGIDTAIKILETTTHLFIFVNQDKNTIHLYDKYLESKLMDHKIRKEKQHVVVCNLRDYNCLDIVSKTILDILKN